MQHAGATGPLLERDDLQCTTAAQERILLATLDQWARETFEPVHGNCALSVHGYVELVTGLTSAAPRSLGGLVKAKLWADEEALATYCGKVWGSMGLQAILTPCRGDVGLLRGVSDSLVAGICLGHGKWALRASRGLAITGLDNGGEQPGEIVRAWSFAQPANARRMAA